MINPANKTKYIVKFYNRITGMEIEQLADIPREVLCFISCLDYLELIKPFVWDDLVNRGMVRKQVQIKYGISEAQAITLGRNLGLYQGNNKKRATCTGYPLVRLQEEVQKLNSM